MQKIEKGKNFFKIIQWNINGWDKNEVDLTILKHTYNPEIICLQETHKSQENNGFKEISGGKVYFYNTADEKGIAIIVKNGVPHNVEFIGSNILAMAVTVQTELKFTVINMYVPQNQKITAEDFVNILKEFHNPILVVGDFNCCSPLWGGDKINRNGKVIEKVIELSNLTILNDGIAATYFSAAHKSFAHIDLSLCSEDIASKCRWSALEELCGSGHFPIILEIGEDLSGIEAFKTEMILLRNLFPHWERTLTLRYNSRQLAWKKFMAAQNDRNLENYRVACWKFKDTIRREKPFVSRPLW